MVLRADRCAKCSTCESLTLVTLPMRQGLLSPMIHVRKPKHKWLEEQVLGRQGKKQDFHPGSLAPEPTL